MRTPTGSPVPPLLAPLLLQLIACAPRVPAPIPDAAASGGGRLVTGARVRLSVLETADLHSHVRSYDYYKLKDDPAVGLERTATLIARARAEFENTLLIDNGDTIQGTVLADYQATVAPVRCDEVLAIYRVMNALGFDAAGVGNHEFNYGLEFLSQVTASRLDVDDLPPPDKQPQCQGPTFPIVLANVHSVRTDGPLFEPYALVDKRVKATLPDGARVETTLTIGVIGFTPPQILAWDRRWLEGKVTTVGVTEAAARYIPEMRRQGADLIVAVSHGGLDAAPYSPTMEDGSYHLSKVPGIDALLMGHSHSLFPNPDRPDGPLDLPGVDEVAGTVNGVPAVMPSYWGKHLGIIALELVHDGLEWRVDRSRTRVDTWATRDGEGAHVDPSPEVAPLVEEAHQATIAYVQTPLGTSDFRMTTYFADVGDVTALQLVNQAQASYVERYVRENLPQLASLPVLSITAPFKSGGSGANDYTDVPAGAVAINNAADLYLFPNTVAAVKVNGALLREWLETAARRFARIDPTVTEPQALVDRSYPGYNFDVFTTPELTYEIDVTAPVGGRIRNLFFRGRPLGADEELIIATNNFRASGGGGFPGLDGTTTLFDAPDTNREVLIRYIQSLGALTRAANGSARSWRFSKVRTAGPVLVRAPADKLGLAQAAGLTNLSLHQADDGTGRGMSLYAVDLSDDGR